MRKKNCEIDVIFLLILKCQQHFSLIALDMSKTKKKVMSACLRQNSHPTPGNFDKVLNTEDGVFDFLLHVLGWYSLQIKYSSIIHILCVLSCRAVYSLKGNAVLSASWLLACRVRFSSWM